MEDLGIKKLIEEIRQENEVERRYLRKQLNMMRILMVSMASIVCILVVTLMILVPQITTTLDTANRALEELSTTAARVNEVFTSVEAASGQNYPQLSFILKTAFCTRKACQCL